MESYSISSVTDYIIILKEILSVSNKEINSRMYLESKNLFDSIYDDKTIANYVNEYNKRINDIKKQIETITSKRNSYIHNQDSHIMNDEIKDKKQYNPKLYYLQAMIINLYQELEHLEKNIKRIKSRPKYKSKANKKNIFYYRGQYGVNYNLLPRIMRKQNLSKESKIYHEIMVNCASDFKGLSHLDKLVYMQHYDCPTRLLDVTKNPLVALYFACKNFNCQKCKCENEGKVYIFAIPEDKVAYSDSDRALMLSCLPKFNEDDKKKLLEKCEEYIYLGKNFDEQCHDEIVERFLHEIRSELPAFRKIINPKDLVDSIIIQPNKINARILRQDGAFIISGLSKNVAEEHQKLASKVYTEIVINGATNMKGILADLDKLGINEATLFPEVDNVAHYLQEHL